MTPTMSDDPVKSCDQIPLSLGTLRALRAKMDRGPWTFETPEPPAGAVDIRGVECRCDEVPPAVMCPQHECIAEWVSVDNAAGIVATHNAMDVFLEHATAALALREQACATERARDRVRRSEEPTGDMYAAVDIEHQRLRICQTAYDAALAKITA